MRGATEHSSSPNSDRPSPTTPHVGDLQSAILDSAHDPIVVIDATGTVREFNPAAERTFGYSRDAAVGQDMASLILPVRFREADRRGLARAPDPSAPAAAMPSLANIHVVCVDDDADALGLMEAVLTGRGARVTCARSVSEALTALNREPPDLLISDIAMPEEDGYALIRAVRASPIAAIRELPAAAVTADATAGDRSRAVLAGFQSHLPKPVEPHELVALVATLAPGRTTPKV